MCNEKDTLPENSMSGQSLRRGGNWWEKQWVQIAAVGGLLALAFALRVIYAHGLPVTQDECEHWDVAKECSLRPGSFYIPLGSTRTNHPGLGLWLTALGDWLGGGSIFAIRVFFTFVQMFGLLGLFFLTRRLFGFQAALIALALGALDRHWIWATVVILETAYLCVIPWILLSRGWNCLEKNRVRDWLLLGLLLGAGYNFYELALFTGIAIPIFSLIRRRHWRVWAGPGPYLTAAVLLVLVLPHLGWNMKQGAPSAGFISSRLNAFSLSPRLLLLYIGDILISFRDTTQAILSVSNEIYAPYWVPCHYLAGAYYLICLVWSLRFWRNDGVAYLLLAFFCLGASVSFVFASQPWNDFWYLNATIVSAIVLASFVSSRLIRHQAGKVLFGGFLLVLSVLMGLFLAGPKIGYFCFDWEKVLRGEIFNLDRRGWTQEPDNPAAVAKVQQLIDKAISEHPNSVIAWYYRARYPRDGKEYETAVKRALQLDPSNPLVILAAVGIRRTDTDRAIAKQCLRDLIAKGRDSYDVRYELATVEYESRDYGKAEENAQSALRFRPDSLPGHILLFTIHTAMGERESASRDFKSYLALCNRSASMCHLKFAIVCSNNGFMGDAESFAREAERLDPRNDAAHQLLARLLYEKEDYAGALAEFTELLRLKPGMEEAKNMIEASKRKLEEQKKNPRPPQRSPDVKPTP